MVSDSDNEDVLKEKERIAQKMVQAVFDHQGEQPQILTTFV